MNNLVVPLATFINSKLTISLFVCMSCILYFVVVGIFGGGGGRGGGSKMINVYL